MVGDIFDFLEEGEYPDWWRKDNIWNYFSVEKAYYAKGIRGRISEQRAEELRKQGYEITIRILYKAKVDLPEYGYRKGQYVPLDVYAEKHEEVWFHNVVAGVGRRHYIYDREECVRFVLEMFERYNRGEITWQEVKEEFSP